MRVRRTAWALSILLLAACGTNHSDGAAPGVAPSELDRTMPAASEPAPPSPSPTCDPIQEVSALPLDTRVRQLLFAGVWTGDGDPIADATAAAAAGVGGINFLGSGADAYANGELAGVSAAAPTFIPFLAIDEEGGRVQRLREIGNSEPSARVMGQTMTPAQVQAVGHSVGQEMAGLGLNMDLAPVADVSSQPDRTVIGDRSYSSDPAQVAEYAGAYADGLRSAGITPVLKHFPGLGSASGNTDQVPATTPPLDQLRASDLIPYQTLLRRQPLAVMLANAVVPGLTDGAPASLSPAAVDLLRTDFGFDGAVMTDSLSAGAISGTHSLPEAAVLALQAGVDLVLWDSTGEIDALAAAVTAAVAAGAVPAAQVDDSVARILQLKGVDLCSAG